MSAKRVLIGGSIPTWQILTIVHFRRVLSPPLGVGDDVHIVSTGFRMGFR